MVKVCRAVRSCHVGQDKLAEKASSYKRGNRLAGEAIEQIFREYYLSPSYCASSSSSLLLSDLIPLLCFPSYILALVV
jgi:hypothetical protein